MTETRCLQYYELLQFVSKKSGDEKLEYIKEHRQKCKHCDEKIVLLERLYASIPEDKEAANRLSQKKQEHISDQTLEFFFHGTLSASEVEDVHRHLIECPGCFQEFSRIYANVHSEITREEEAILRDVDNVLIADRLGPYKKQFLPSVDELPSHAIGKVARFKDFVNALLPNPRLRWAVIGVVFCMLLILPVQFGIKHYGIVRTIETAEQELAGLLSDYRIVAGQLRPAGGFERGMISDTRGSETRETDILTPSIRHALDLRPENARLNHQVGTLYFFQGEIDKAEDYYLKALVLDENNAKIYNDLALIDVERDQYEQALKHLQQALELQPTLLEARYNLAVVRELTNDKANAIKAWKKYLEFDPNPGSEWHKIATARLQKLTQE